MPTKIWKNSVSVLIAINLILAVLALLRDVFLAAYLGTSIQADAFWLSYFLPDMVGNNLLAGAIGVACVPVFSKLFIKGDNHRLGECAAGVVFWTVLFSAGIMAVMLFFRHNLIINLGKGFAPHTSILSLQLFLIIIPTIVVFPLITIGSALMQVFGRFALPACAPVMFNVIFLGGALTAIIRKMPLDKGVNILAHSVTAGVMFMAIMVGIGIKMQLPSLKIKKNLLHSHSWKYFKEICHLFLPYLLVLLCMQSVLSIERYLASALSPGSVAGLNYAYRVAQFPIWVFIAALSTVILPSMSKFDGTGNKIAFRETLIKAVKITLLITLPLTVGLFVLREPVVAILFQRGAFNIASLETTTVILAGYALAITGQSISYVGIRAFLARGELAYPLYAGIIAAGANIILDFIFVKEYQAAGLGYGAAVGASLNAVIMLYLLDKKLELRLGGLAKGFVKIISANLPLVLVLVQLKRIWELELFQSGPIFLGIYIIVSLVSCTLVYFYSLRMLKVI